MNVTTIRTARGAEVRVFERGPDDAPPLVFMHGISGLLDDWRLLDALAERHHVYAPELPGYGESRGETLLEDMLDFALHGWDVLAALELVQRSPVLVGHSLGGMIAAEMACLAPQSVRKLVLVDAFGLWRDREPIPDVFALLPYELADLLFEDPERAATLLPGTVDNADPEALRTFFVENARRLGTAGKVLFPIPNRRLSKRLYRMSVDTLVVWAEHDRLMTPAYAQRWSELIPHARASVVPGAGHMLPYEQPFALAELIEAFADELTSAAP